MYPKKCAECGGVVSNSCGSVPLEIRGETFEVSGIEHARCESCAEVYLTLDASDELQRRAIRMSKESRGLLVPEEIRALRESLSLSQAAFEEMLGIGPKTVVRWEKGTVYQSATADRLMRLLIVYPELANVLSGGALQATATVCTPRVTRRIGSENWTPRRARSTHLRVVANGDNAAAA
jgi:HTH-type transcriptional regulator/antitoxin MqsA